MKTITPIAIDLDGHWLSVDEVLPEPLHDVLVSYEFMVEQIVEFAHRKKDGQWVLTGSDPALEIDPTHWMPTPAPKQQ